MKKKALALLMALVMCLSLLPVTAAADENATITLDLNGGTLTTTPPEGWTDLGNGKYSKQYPTKQWAYFGNEWSDCIPQKEGCVFSGWDDGTGWTINSVYLQGDRNFLAKYLAMVNVVVDLKGGSIPSGSVPEGWTLVNGETDKYVKGFAEETSYYSILNEWNNVVPQYTGAGFIEWTYEGFQLGNTETTIEAKVGTLRDVTVDFCGATVLTAPDSWTKVSDGIYKKQFPEGAGISFGAYNEVLNGFKVAERRGNDFFLNQYDYEGTTVGENTTFTAKFTPGYTLSITAPDHATMMINGEKKTGTCQYFVSSQVFMRVNNGVLTIDDSQYNKSLGKLTVEVYGDAGYTLDEYQLNSAAFPAYVSGISADMAITAAMKSGNQTYPVWIDGVQLANGATSLLEGSVSYDPATKVLTLDGANIVSDKAAAINFGTDITINVKSDSKISCAGNNKCVIAGTAFNESYMSFDSCSSALKITGPGKLTVDLGSINEYGYLYFNGISASTVSMDTDVDILCGSMYASGYYAVTFKGITASNVYVNDAALNISANSLTDGMGMPTCYMINGSLTMDEAMVSISVGTFSSYYGGAQFVAGTLTLNSGTISASSGKEGSSLNLSKPANLVSISGANAGATTMDLTFTQASTSAPLVLVAEAVGPVDPPAPPIRHISSAWSGRLITAVVANMPTLRPGDLGEEVELLQTMLNAMGYECGTVDGIYGSKTYAAVSAFQEDLGISIDGCVGPQTWGRLSGIAAATSAVEVTIMSNMPLITSGSCGSAVKALQARLNELGYDCGKVDGIFGEKTLAAVKAYQADHALLVDGKVGKQTWGALQ